LPSAKRESRGPAEEQARGIRSGGGRKLSTRRGGKTIKRGPEGTKIKKDMKSTQNRRQTTTRYSKASYTVVLVKPMLENQTSSYKTRAMKTRKRGLLKRQIMSDRENWVPKPTGRGKKCRSASENGDPSGETETKRHTMEKETEAYSRATSRMRR